MYARLRVLVSFVQFFKDPLPNANKTRNIPSAVRKYSLSLHNLKMRIDI